MDRPLLPTYSYFADVITQAVNSMYNFRFGNSTRPSTVGKLLLVSLLVGIIPIGIPFNVTYVTLRRGADCVVTFSFAPFATMPNYWERKYPHKRLIGTSSCHHSAWSSSIACNKFPKCTFNYSIFYCQHLIQKYCILNTFRDNSYLVILH